MIQFKPFSEPYEFLFLNRPLGKSISFKPGETIKAEVMDILPNGAIIAKLKDTTAMLKTEIPLQKGTTLLLKVMDSANSDKKLKLKIVEQFKTKTTKNIADAIKDLNFKDNKNLLFEIVENSPKKEEILKSLINSGLTKEIKNINMQINNLFELLKNSAYAKTFNQMFKNIKELNYKNLEVLIQNSGIFYESKLKELKKDSKNDLKSILLDIQEGTKDKKIKQNVSNILNQIESFQLLSTLIDGIYTFLPIFENSLNGGNIAIKKGEKESYLCSISLDFKDLGAVDVHMFLYKNDIKIDFFIENENLKEEIRQNIDFLKNELNKDGFSNIFINFSLQKDDKILEKLQNFKSIVDVKV